MGRLSLSLIAVVLCGLIGLSWLFDNLFQQYQSKHSNSIAQQAEPLAEIFKVFAEFANAQSDLDSWLESWPQGSDYKLSIADINRLALPAQLYEQLMKGQVLELASQDTLQMYALLNKHQSLLVLSSPMLDPDAPVEDSKRFWISSLFYSLIISLLLLWMSPLLYRLMKLRQVAKAFGEGKLTQRVNVGKGSYIRDLEMEFNHMAQRIEGLVADVKLLSCAVSHDLRTPLAKIGMGLDTLSDETDPVKRANYQARIQQHVDEMTELVEALLKYARLDQAQLKLSFQPTDIKPILRSICDLYDKDETIVTFQVTSTDILVLADAFYLKLIFTNLIENAARYSSGHVEVSIKAHGTAVEIVISDNGPGIPENLKDDIFKPFIRGEHYDKQGFGLGLAIVKRIADWHQAELTVGKSETLGGAEIVVRLMLVR
jgi:two-component system OmpR family sensor kinase